MKAIKIIATKAMGICVTGNKKSQTKENKTKVVKSQNKGE